MVKEIKICLIVYENCKGYIKHPYWNKYYNDNLFGFIKIKLSKIK